MSILRCITFLYDYLLNSPWHRFHHLFHFLVAEGAPNLKQRRLASTPQEFSGGPAVLESSSSATQIQWYWGLESYLAIPRHQSVSLSGTWMSCGHDELVQGRAGTQSYHPQRVSPQMEAGKHPADRCALPCSLLSLGTRSTICPLLEMKCIPRPLRRLDAWQSASDKAPCAFHVFAAKHEAPCCHSPWQISTHPRRWLFPIFNCPLRVLVCEL